MTLSEAIHKLVDTLNETTSVMVTEGKLFERGIILIWLRERGETELADAIEKGEHYGTEIVPVN